MLQLQEIVQRTPCLILFFGTEKQFVKKVHGLREPVKNPEALEFECFANVEDALNFLYKREETPLTQGTRERLSNIYVYGLMSYLRAHGEASYAALTRQIIAFSCTGRAIIFADDCSSEYYDKLVAYRQG